MRCELRVTSGSHTGRRMFLRDGQTLQVGRTEYADLCVADDPLMSRVHFALDSDGGVVRIRDLGSRNGCYVNGQLIETAELKHGDIIVAGQTRFDVLLEVVDGSSSQPYGMQTINDSPQQPQSGFTGSAPDQPQSFAQPGNPAAPSVPGGTPDPTAFPQNQHGELASTRYAPGAPNAPSQPNQAAMPPAGYPQQGPASAQPNAANPNAAHPNAPPTGNPYPGNPAVQAPHPQAGGVPQPGTPIPPTGQQPGVPSPGAMQPGSQQPNSQQSGVPQGGHAAIDPQSGVNLPTGAPNQDAGQYVPYGQSPPNASPGGVPSNPIGGPAGDPNAITNYPGQQVGGPTQAPFDQSGIQPGGPSPGGPYAPAGNDPSMNNATSQPNPHAPGMGYPNEAGQLQSPNPNQPLSVPNYQPPSAGMGSVYGNIPPASFDDQKYGADPAAPADPNSSPGQFNQQANPAAQHPGTAQPGTSQQNPAWGTTQGGNPIVPSGSQPPAVNQGSGPPSQPLQESSSPIEFQNPEQDPTMFGQTMLPPGTESPIGDPSSAPNIENPPASDESPISFGFTQQSASSPSDGAPSPNEPPPIEMMEPEANDPFAVTDVWESSPATNESGDSPIAGYAEQGQRDDSIANEPPPVIPPAPEAHANDQLPQESESARGGRFREDFEAADDSDANLKSNDEFEQTMFGGEISFETARQLSPTDSLVGSPPTDQPSEPGEASNSGAIDPIPTVDAQPMDSVYDDIEIEIDDADAESDLSRDDKPASTPEPIQQESSTPPSVLPPYESADLIHESNSTPEIPVVPTEEAHQVSDQAAKDSDQLDLSGDESTIAYATFSSVFANVAYKAAQSSTGLHSFESFDERSNAADIAKSLIDRNHAFLLVNVQRLDEKDQQLFASGRGRPTHSKLSGDIALVTKQDPIDMVELVRSGWGKQALVLVVTGVTRNKIQNTLMNRIDLYAYPNQLTSELQRASSIEAQALFQEIEAFMVETHFGKGWSIYMRPDLQGDWSTIGMPCPPTT